MVSSGILFEVDDLCNKEKKIVKIIKLHSSIHQALADIQGTQPAFPEDSLHSAHGTPGVFMIFAVTYIILFSTRFLVIAN